MGGQGCAVCGMMGGGTYAQHSMQQWEVLPLGKPENSEEHEHRRKIRNAYVLVPANPFSSACFILLTCKIGVTQTFLSICTKTSV